MRTRFALGLLLLVLPAVLWASGTLIYEQGSKATAQAGAFVARADDATAVFYNPAGIAFAKGMQFSFNETYINTNVHYDTSHYDPTYVWKDPSANIAGRYANNAQNFFLEGLYFTMPINDLLSFGVMADSPFDLATDWSNQFPGRFSSRHAKIITYDIRPVLTVRFNNHNAMGFGVDYYDSEIELLRSLNTSALSTAINPNTYPSPPYPAGIPYYVYSEGTIDTHLRDQSWGWNISYMFKDAPWSFGATYRSRASFNYEGHTSFTTSPAIAPLALAGYFPGQTTRMSLTSVPAIATAGFAYDNKTFTVEFDVQWTEWSTWNKSYGEVLDAHEFRRRLDRSAHRRPDLQLGQRLVREAGLWLQTEQVLGAAVGRPVQPGPNPGRHGEPRPARFGPLVLPVRRGLPERPLRHRLVRHVLEVQEQRHRIGQREPVLPHGPALRVSAGPRPDLPDDVSGHTRRPLHWRGLPRRLPDQLQVVALTA